jgi:COX assembly protein 1
MFTNTEMVFRIDAHTQVIDFAICAREHTFTSTFTCRPQQRVMNSCMMAFATLEEQDRAREEWFATRDQRRKERQLKEEKRKDAEEFHRKWWGLDESGRRVVRAEDDREGLMELAREVAVKGDPKTR